MEYGAPTWKAALAFLQGYRMSDHLLRGPMYLFGWEAWRAGESMPAWLKHRKAIRGWIARAEKESHGT